MNESQIKRIGFDMDGVIMDHFALKQKLAGDFGFNLSYKELPSDIFKEVIPKEIRRKIQDELYLNPEFAYNAALIDGVTRGLELLSKNNIPFFLISRRKNPNLAKELLQKHNLWPSHFNENNSYFVINPEDKNVCAKQLGITHYVDDEMNVLDVLNDVENKILFCPVRESNEKNYKIAGDWSELMEMLLD